MNGAGLSDTIARLVEEGPIGLAEAARILRHFSRRQTY